MVSDSVPAVFGLNKFLWDRIEAAEILGDNYGGLVPIIPNQEVPLLKQAMDEQEGLGSFPYIVYSWYTNGYAQDWFKPTDTVIYRINATNGKQLRQLLLLVIDTFKRYDESAVALNAFIQESTDLSDEFKRYDYKSVYTAAAQAGSPTDLEDEPVEATVTVRVQYTNERDNESL